MEHDSIIEVVETTIDAITVAIEAPQSLVINEDASSSLIINEDPLETISVEEVSNDGVVINEEASTSIVIPEEPSVSVQVNEGGIVLGVTPSTIINASQVQIDAATPRAGGVALNLQEVLNSFATYRFEHIQAVAASTWNITHNLTYIPVYTLISLTGDVINACVNLTATTATVQSNSPITGILLLR